MMDFPLAQGGYQYRSLKKATPTLRGWDVFAVQTALMVSGFSMPKYGADGFFGAESESSVKGFQDLAGIKADGIAGILTQRELGSRIAVKIEHTLVLPHGLLYGAVEGECGWQLGNHTAPYKDGNRDLGPVERNAEPTAANCVLWFNVLPAIRALGKFIQERFRTYGKDEYGLTEQRAWELAVGAWNRPAWTDTLARGGTLKPEQRDWIEGYIARATTYVDWA